MSDYKMTKNKYRRKVSFKSLSRLMAYLFAYKLQMLLVMVCVLVSTITQIIGVNMLEPIIDDYILKSDLPGLRMAVVKMAFIYLVSALTSMVYSRLMVRVGQRSIKTIKNDLYEKIQSLPINFFDTNRHGEILSRFSNDIDVLAGTMSNTVPTIIRSLLTFFGTLLVMFRLDFNLTLILLVGLGVMIPALSRLTIKTGKNFAQAQKKISKIHGFDEEILSGQKVVKVFSREDKVNEEFGELSEDLRQSLAKAQITAGKIMPFLVNSVNILYALITVLGVYLTINDYITVGLLAAFLSNIRQIQNPVQNISQQANVVFQSLAGADRIFEVMDMEVEEDRGIIDLDHVVIKEDGKVESSDDLTGLYAWKWEDGEDVHYKPLRGEIVFKNVDFSYDGKNKILKDISFYAKPGQKIAFVGSTGAGKTTITNVITRFYEIDNGAIEIDGIDVRDIKKDALRRAFGMVLQDVNLFTDTVGNNIKYGKLDASEDEIKDAAKLSGANSFIKRLPDKYQSKIRGDGSSLSDGQNQLISISRAAISKPPMLILDEATSSIDTATEIEVTRAMDKLMEGSTSIVIAHRLSTIQNSDVIMVMEDGRIIERGSHEELMKERGTYWQLYTGRLELD